jgi:hypothetical protein
MITFELISKIRNNWKKASYDFNFKIISPYIIDMCGVKKEIFAHISSYGSPNGTIIGLISPPEYEIDEDIFEWSKINNVFVSFISAEGLLEYNKKYFEDILSDWGRY